MYAVVNCAQYLLFKTTNFSGAVTLYFIMENPNGAVERLIWDASAELNLNKRAQLISLAYSALAPATPSKVGSGGMSVEHVPLLHYLNAVPTAVPTRFRNDKM